MVKYKGKRVDAYAIVDDTAGFPIEDMFPDQWNLSESCKTGLIERAKLKGHHILFCPEEWSGLDHAFIGLKTFIFVQDEETQEVKPVSGEEFKNDDVEITS